MSGLQQYAMISFPQYVNRYLKEPWQLQHPHQRWPPS